VIEGLLRREMGFTGVVSTDCMEMKAVTNAYGPGESAVLAALAGASTILFSHTRANQEAAHDALIEAAQSGRLPEEKIDFAVSKVLAMKERYAITDTRPVLDIICHPDHLAITETAARAGMVLLHDQQGNLPVQGSVALVEFASHLDTLAWNRAGRPGSRPNCAQRCPVWACAGSLAVGGFAGAGETLAGNADLLIVATRSAHTPRNLLPELISRPTQHRAVPAQSL
jgi:beta-glucosidase-like glycosyl hydrolase